MLDSIEPKVAAPAGGLAPDFDGVEAGLMATHDDRLDAHLAGGLQMKLTGGSEQFRSRGVAPSAAPLCQMRCAGTRG